MDMLHRRTVKIHAAWLFIIKLMSRFLIQMPTLKLPQRNMTKHIFGNSNSPNVHGPNTILIVYEVILIIISQKKCAATREQENLGH